MLYVYITILKKTYTDILYGLCVLNCDIIKGEVEFGSI